MTATKAKTVTYYGRLAFDVEPGAVQEQVDKARAMIEKMQFLLDTELTHEQAFNTLAEFYEESQTLLVMATLRPIFLSHLIGRLKDDGVTLTALARRLGTTRQVITRAFYDGQGGRTTTIPRSRPKRPVTRKRGAA